LVIIVTPRLVEPAGAPVRLVTPLDDRLPSNDVDLFLNGKTEIPKKVLETITGPDGTGGHAGHIIK
jgi:pilus assembly protein CpaC